MLRRTAARAFGTPDDDGSLGARPDDGGSRLPAGGPSIRRDLAVERLFDALRELLDARVAASSPDGAGMDVASGEGGPGHPSPGPAPERSPGALHLTRPRPRLEGVEFRLEGARATVRIVHTLRGFLRVVGEPKDGAPWQELLSVAWQGGEYRPLRKPRSRSASRRSGFALTSVPELAARYLARVQGIEGS